MTMMNYTDNLEENMEMLRNAVFVIQIKRKGLNGLKNKRCKNCRKEIDKDIPQEEIDLHEGLCPDCWDKIEGW